MTEEVGGKSRQHQFRPVTDEESQEITKNIRARYEAGTPFFTKEGLQAVHDQLQHLNGQSGTISIPDLNGEHTERHIRLGEAFSDPDDSNASELVSTKASIRYYTIQETLPRASYKSIEIGHRLERRHKKTKALINPPIVRSQQETEDYFRAAIEAWEANIQCKQLRKLLESKPNLTVNKVVAFANASFASHGPGCHGEDRASRAAYQHALMLTLTDHFDVKSNSFAQDPAYKDEDQQALSQCGIKVVEDPEGFLQADENSAVISMYPDIPVKQVLCDLASPAILIWSKVVGSDSAPCTDPNSSRVHKIMEEQYDCHDFPKGLDQYFGSSIVIYVKKDKQAVAGAEELS